MTGEDLIITEEDETGVVEGAVGRLFDQVDRATESKSRLFSEDGKTILLAYNGAIPGFLGFHFFSEKTLRPVLNGTDVTYLVGVTQMDGGFGMIINSDKISNEPLGKINLAIANEAEHIRQFIIKPNMPDKVKEIGATAHMLKVYKELLSLGEISSDKELDDLLGQIAMSRENESEVILKYLKDQGYNF